MQEFGYKQVTLWLDASEAAVITEAAKLSGERLATWIRKVALAAAASIQVQDPV